MRECWNASLSVFLYFWVENVEQFEGSGSVWSNEKSSWLEKYRFWFSSRKKKHEEPERTKNVEREIATAKA